MGAVTYRRFNTDDSTELRFVAQTDVAIPAMFEADFPVDEKTIQERMAHFKEKFTAEDFMEVAVNANNEIVGFHIVKKIPYFTKLAGNIYTIWVAPEYRQQGIGRALKLKAEEWARSLQLDHMSTFVHVSNSAMLALNKEAGFEVSYYKLKRKL